MDDIISHIPDGELLFKWLNPNGAPAHGGSGKWHLPKDGKPGKWMPKIRGELIPCQNGYHLCRVKDLQEWSAPEVYLAEYHSGINDDERINDDNKIVVRQARLLKKLNWDERIARLFACDCSEHVLHIFEKERPNDNRPRQAIETARRFANGKANKTELDAARCAAGAAAWSATGCAAGAAAWSATGYAAGAAAWSAARCAAGAAAWSATGYAAGAAAWSATGCAAGAAAWSAAWDAAGYAEIKWQNERLLKYLFSN